MGCPNHMQTTGVKSWLLGIFAKRPIARQVKTRLAEATSPAFAQAVAEAFLKDVLDRFATIAARRAILFAPGSAHEYFARVAADRYEFIPQCDGDLGVRLQHYFAVARARGMSSILAVGTDSPTLPSRFIEQAFSLLETHDVVIGPAFDGGYYLIGTGARELPIFDGIDWSTPRVLDQTVQRVRDAKASLALLPPWYDIDTADDWMMLCGHIKAMRQAGIDPGVPHTEALMKGDKPWAP